MLAFGIFKKTRSSNIEGAGLTEDVARINHAEIFLCKTAFQSRVGIHSAEGETCERMFVFRDMWCVVAEYREEFTKSSIFPNSLSVNH